MHRHTEMQLLVRSLGATERTAFLQSKDIPSISPTYFTLLSTQSNLTSSEMAKRLDLSEKQYRTMAESLYKELYEFVLLHNNVIGEDLEMQIRRAELVAQSLKERRLLNAAEQELKNALEIAKQYELFDREISLRYQYLRLSGDKELPLTEAKVTHRLQQIIRLSDKQHELHALQNIYLQLLTLRYKMALRTTIEEQGDIKALQEKLLLYVPEKIQSIGGYIYFHLAALLSSFMIGDTQNITLWNASLLQCWQEHSHLIKVQPERFVRSLSIAAYTQFLINDIAAAQNCLEQYRQLAAEYLPNDFYKNWFAIIDFHTSSKILHKTYQYEMLATLYATKWDRISTILWIMRDSEKLDILLSGSITFFVLQQWDKAETYIQEVKAINQKVKRIDTLYFTFVFHGLILYEQKEWNRLNSLINTEYHFLYSHKTLRPFEKDMLLFIKKLPVIVLKEKGKESLKAFLQSLDKYRENNMEKLHFTYFDFYCWIESKIEGMPYSQYRRNRAMQQ